MEVFVMARGRRKEVTYTGKALKVYEKVQRLEAELKGAKAELKIAYKEQIKEEKAFLITNPIFSIRDKNKDYHLHTN